MLKPADKAGTTMYVAHDHLGVIRIVCATPESAEISKIQEEPGLWWYTIPLTDDRTKIKADSDGMKIRSLYREGERCFIKHYWSRPMSPSSLPRIIDLLLLPKNLPHIKRTNSLVLNDVGMRALSACFSPTFSSIFAHYEGSPELIYNAYRLFTKRYKPLWLHFILDKGEQISEIWNWHNMARGKGIVFRTNKADLPPGEPTTIYLEEPCTTLLALHGEAPAQGVKEPPIETVSFVERPDKKTSWTPKHIRGAHYSSAPLTGLASITPCWSKTLGHAREPEEGVCHIIGLVLQYKGGRARVLGQGRLDSLGQPLDVESCDGISLKYEWEKDMLENVRLGKFEEDGWMWMPWEGSMTWWFNNGSPNKIFHEPE
ncbi:hypothetical protein NW768_007771 [Fusarium equiseti]|uniref:Uncharacterized protein n=1 Tax=Fusarium equiseti TaxID=61235 RepID=A0ABQ8R8Q6_FUSEQ|nr:hypothetical protein NW768_007771 [Fusarium equiseti]